MFLHGTYWRIHTVNKRIMTLQPFAEFEKQIPPQIDSIEKHRIKIKDLIVPLSETYREKFFALINH